MDETQAAKNNAHTKLANELTTVVSKATALNTFEVIGVLEAVKGDLVTQLALARIQASMAQAGAKKPSSIIAPGQFRNGGGIIPEA